VRAVWWETITYGSEGSSFRLTLLFWAYFHSSLAPAVEIGSEWPPKGIEPLNASEVPTANTTLLLSSGAAVTVSHHSLVDRAINWANYGSIATIIMAIFFTFLQGLEYFQVPYTIADSVYGSTFFMGTGLILGPILISSNYLIITGKYFFRKFSSYLLFILPPYWVTGFSDLHLL
jgi:cytochrome c oxidase subunit 3